MKVVSIVGARPQFIKAAAVSRSLRKEHVEVLVHTGQHYDVNMSEVFFRELDIPNPDYNLGVGSNLHGAQTGEMLERIEQVLISEKPERVLVYGDTNSTLAGALATVKLHIKVAHVEAGLRSYNRGMPEEINRVIVDHISAALFCPSQVAVENLASEGISDGVFLVGDVMAEALAFAVERARAHSDVLRRLGLGERGYLLATVHRAENTDNVLRLKSILSTFARTEEPIVFPVHPRTRQVLASQDFVPSPNLIMIDPIGYLDMVRLEQSTRMILTDSGGIQKEAYWLGIPCVTLRDETEWVETVEAGWNVVVGANPEKIIHSMRTFVPPDRRPPIYGDGQAATRIVQLLGCT